MLVRCSGNAVKGTDTRNKKTNAKHTVQPIQNTLGMFSKTFCKTFRKTLLYPMTGEWSGQGLGQDKKCKWECRQHGDWMRRNKIMKIVIDTFKRYYQNGTEALIHTKNACALFSLYKRNTGSTTFNLISTRRRGLVDRNFVITFSNWGSISQRLFLMWKLTCLM